MAGNAVRGLNVFKITKFYSFTNMSHYRHTYTYSYKPSVLFVGHRQTVKTQIRRRRMRRLIRISTICL